MVEEECAEIVVVRCFFRSVLLVVVVSVRGSFGIDNEPFVAQQPVINGIEDLFGQTFPLLPYPSGRPWVLDDLFP